MLDILQCHAGMASVPQVPNHGDHHIQRILRCEESNSTNMRVHWKADRRAAADCIPADLVNKWKNPDQLVAVIDTTNGKPAIGEVRLEKR
jgi:hypothetical protein